MKNKKQKEQAIKGILSDYIIWSRVYMAMNLVLNSYSPKTSNEHFEADSNYNGYLNAFLVLGIDEEDELCQELCTILHDHMSESLENATTLANKVYMDWLMFIRGFSLKAA